MNRFTRRCLLSDVSGKSEKVLIRDVQHHPYKIDVMHMDFIRVDENRLVHVFSQLHFIGEDESPGVKNEAGVVNHVVTEVELECLPGNIPSHIEIDLSEMHVGDVIHLTDLKLPEGVSVLALKQGDEHDTAVVGMHVRKVTEEVEEEGAPETPKHQSRKRRWRRRTRRVDMSARSIDLKAIVGLGNPGSKYTETRHNAGFWFIDEVARKYSAVLRPDKKFHGEVAKISIEGSDIWLLKPATFMNLSGLAVQSLLSFYRFSPDQLLVAHDEIDLPPGTAKLKYGGGHGGHNGLRDIISQLGSKDFYRLRIGVGHPGNKDQVVDYVLNNASRDDRILIDRDIDDAVSVMPDLASGALEQAMQSLHSK